MPSKPVLKAVSDNDFPETDPMAELSRIMGLNQKTAETEASADFEIDLEQELMGEFAREAESAAAAPAGQADLSMLDADFDDAFSGMLAAEDIAPAEGKAADVVADEAALQEDLAELDAAFESIELTLDEAAPAHDAAVESDRLALETPATTVGPIEDAAEELPALAPAMDAPGFEAAPATVAAASAPVAASRAPGIAPVIAPVVASAPSLEDELRALLGRVNTPSLRTPTPANDGGKVEMRAAPVADSIQDVAHQTAPEPVATTDGPQADASASRTVEIAETAEVEDDPLPTFEDFSFADFDFDSADLATALEETLERDANLHAAAEAEYAKHIAKSEPVALNPVEPAQATDGDDAFSVDLEAELATFADAEVEPMKPEDIVPQKPAATAPVRPLTFTEERRAAATGASPAQPAAFDWRQRYTEMKTADQQPKPAPKAPEPRPAEPDPFAALAALATQPPSGHTYSRATPVAGGVQPQAAARPAESLREPSPALSSWRAQAAAATAPRAPEASPAPPRAEPPVSARTVAPVVAPAPRAATPEPVQPRADFLASLRPAPAPQPRAESANLGLRSSFPAAGVTASTFASPSMAAAAPAPRSAPVPVAPPKDEIDDFDLAALLDDAHLAPEIDTVELADGVSLADELEIPDLAIEEPVAAKPNFDDLEADFADAFQQLSLASQAKPSASEPKMAQPSAAAPTAGYDDDGFDFGRDEFLARDDQRSSAPSRAGQPQAFDAVDDDFDHQVYAAPAQRNASPVRQRGLMLAAAVAVVAIVGGIGAWALTGGTATDDAPALVKADPAPVKVKPENPGGTVVPNQTGQVYDQVRGTPAPAPAQEKLVTAAEEPLSTMPVAAPEASAATAAADSPPATTAQPGAEAVLPGVVQETIKSEDRILPEETAQSPAATEEVAAIAPRKVRTMIVRPDGTLVPREDPPAASAEPIEAPRGVPTGADPATMAVVQPGQQVPSAIPNGADDVSILPAEDAENAPSSLETPSASEVIVPMPRPQASAAPVAAEPVRTVAAAPVREVEAAPARPVRAEPAPEPVVQPVSAPVAAAPGANVWTVQIASQPTREGAQSTYEDLAGRYGSVLGGKGVNIVQAEVSGKGTMWRVRVPAASKADANILCAKLKTAGGSCFVTQ